MSYNSVPTTPVKEILAYSIPDGEDPNMLHCRVPNHVVTRGGPDSVFTWIDMLGTDRFVWRPVASQYATLGVCLDIRRDGDENEPFLTHDGMADMMLQLQGPELAAKNNADSMSLSAPQQQQHPYALPIAPAPFQLPPPSGAGTPNSLFSEGDNARDFSPPSSPRPAPQVGPASAALPPPLMLPGGNGTIAPRDIFSPHAFGGGLALPPASPPQAFPQMPLHRVDERRNRRAREKRKMPWDDSDSFEASDEDASGDDDSEFAGPNTSRGGRTRKTSSAGGSPRGEPKSPLPCKFPGCDFVQRNGRQVDLVRHEQTHYPARPKHKCPDCGHEVSRKDALRRHQEQSCKKPGVGGVKRTSRKKTRRSFN